MKMDEMRVKEKEGLLTKEQPAYIATIGFFDGVHLGHQFLLQELNFIAQQRHQQSLAITFERHPRKVLCSSFQPQLLTNNTEKINLLRKQVDKCVILDFDMAMAALTAKEFMQQVLKEQLNVKTILLGYDHRFGSDGLTDFLVYEEIGQNLGIEVIKATQYTFEGQHVSSSVIRKLIEAGNVADASKLIGRNYQLSGKVINGHQIGRQLGFPTANLQPDNPDKLIPCNGVYAVKIQWDERQFCGMMNIGVRPTIELPAAQVSLEVHIFDFNENLYGQILTIDFIQRIRDEIYFNSQDALHVQLQKDRAECMRIIGAKEE